MSSSAVGTLASSRADTKQKSLTRKAASALLSRTKRKTTKPVHGRTIKEKDYPKLITLKLAGRQNHEIAQILQVPKETVVPHAQRAMLLFREGKLRADHNAVHAEIEDKANQDLVEFSKRIAEVKPIFEAKDSSAEIDTADGDAEAIEVTLTGPGIPENSNTVESSGGSSTVGKVSAEPIVVTGPTAGAEPISVTA